MRFILSSLIMLSILSCGKDSPETVESVITFNLTVTSSTGGKVSSSGGPFESGSNVSITATPDSEYVFVNWSNGSTDNPLSVTVNSNQTITANFEKRKYPLTVSITGSGTVSEEIISSGKSTTEYNSGSVIRLTANPSDGWEFSGWSGSVSSLDNPIQLTVNESKSVSVTFIREPFVSRSPQYSQINQTSGEIKSNFYYPGDVLINKAPAQFFKPKVEGVYTTQFLSGDGYFIIDGKSYGVVESGVNFLDLKNDNILDMIGFFYDTRFNFSPGYFFVMIDVFGEKEVQIFNTESWVVPRYEINDLNGDGYLDVMTFTSNSHPDPDGNEGSENLPVKLYFFDSNGNFTEEYTGPSFSHHDGASGDIDNDGDVDIFVHGTQDIWGPNVIGLYINDGLGSFTFNTDLINNGEPPSVFINTMQSLSHRLVDIDGDNCLDIIMGAHFNDDLISSANTYPPYIHWGDCSGEFTFDTINSNNTSVLPNETVNDLDQTYDFIVLGQNFFDIDNDGDLDIVVSLTTNDQDNFYQYYYLQILINNGDRTFTDRTEIIDHNFGDGPFYRTRIHDIDNDGDFEIIPYQRDAVNIPNLGFYWENRGGTFIRIDY